MHGLTLHRQVDAARADDLTERLVAFNRAHTTAAPGEPRERQPLQLFALDETGAMRAGLIGRTHAIADWLEISLLWVDEEVRGQGLGRQLMREAERVARERGCRFARLATSTYQAPGFYERLGYALYGQLADCPPGETVSYYWKALGAERAS